jgi:putative flippase GtrA
MPLLTERVRAASQREHVRRLVKFAAVSVISTVVTQSVLFLTYDIWKIGSAMESNVIATAVATVPAYWLNRNWTWKKTGKSNPWKELAPFWIIAFIGLVLSTVAVGVAAHNADHISTNDTVRKAFVQFANLSTYAVIWVGRYFVFNKFLFGNATPASELEVPGEVEAIALEEKLSHDAKSAARSGAKAAGGAEGEPEAASEAEPVGAADGRSEAATAAATASSGAASSPSSSTGESEPSSLLSR